MAGREQIWILCFHFHRFSFSRFWLCWVFLLGVGSLSHWTGFSCCGVWTLECAASVAAVCGFSCPMACTILVPRPGVEPTSSALGGGFLTTGPPGTHPLPTVFSTVVFFCLFAIRKQTGEGLHHWTQVWNMMLAFSLVLRRGCRDIHPSPCVWFIGPTEEKLSFMEHLLHVPVAKPAPWVH